MQSRVWAGAGARAVCEEVPISSGNQLDIAIISDAELAAHGGSERVKSI